MPGHWNVIEGDCVEQMAMMDEASVDAVVCDPPYGLEFMGVAWDTLGKGGPRGTSDFDAPGSKEHPRTAQAQQRVRAKASRNMQTFHEAWAREALRVLKPGGDLLAFGGTRTYHRLACAIEDAGFEIRDTIAWMYGQGFPKSRDVAKDIDAAAGVERETVPIGSDGATRKPRAMAPGGAAREAVQTLSEPVTPEAKRWQGWGTALKPAHEPIVVARKPLVGTVAGNVLAHGTGALNVDGCRTEGDVPSVPQPDFGSVNGRATHLDANARNGEMSHAAGRWPANVVLDPEAAAMLDEQTGDRPGFTSQNDHGSAMGFSDSAVYGTSEGRYNGRREGFNDSGGASRFFYCAKSSSAERNAGLDGFEAVERTGQSTWAGCCNVCGCRMMLYGKPTCGHDDFRWVQGKPTRNSHPTVKPIALMRWLVRLVTPPGGLVCDPFAGSGTTGCAAMLEGFRFVGIERDPEYTAIARARIAWWAEHPEGMELVARLEHEAERKRVAGSGQLGLFG